MNRSKIKRQALVVEDEPVIARICSDVLSDEGFDANIAPNGMLAIEKAKDKHYDLFIIDIRMPEMNGIEFYKYLMTSYSDAANRVIFTTGALLSDDIAEFVEKAQASFLPKPFAPSALRKLIRSVMGHSNDSAKNRSRK